MRRLYCFVVGLLLLGSQAAQASSLDKALVHRVIHERQAEYQKCYTDALQWNPQLKGRLVIRFTVEADGEVSKAVEQQEGQRFPDEVMTGCVLSQFQQLRFHPGPAQFQVVYPLIFVPQQQKGGATKEAPR